MGGDGDGREGASGAGISRRGFIAGAAGLTGVALSGAVRVTAARAAGNPFLDRVTTNPGYAFLELEGTIVGSVRSFVGGDPYGDVVDEAPDPVTGLIRKHLGGVKYDELTLECGLGMAPAFYDWISAFVQGTETGMDGNVIITDASKHKKSRLQFTNAFISEVAFPALNVASPAVVAMTVKLFPTSTSLHTASGTVSVTPSNQQLWRSANFVIAFTAADGSRVSSIDAFSVRQTLFDSAGKRFTLPRPVVSDLGITLAQSQATTWTAWFDDFVVNGSGNEGGGTLRVKNATLSTVLAEIGFQNLGIFRLDPVAPFPSSTETVRRVKAEMYCEQLTFTFHP
jgi:tail tube protein gp19